MRPAEESAVAVVTVVGGANTDLQAFPAGELRMEDSNPGTLRVSSGGVGRNIAENLVRLGLDVRFICAVGDDDRGNYLLEELRELGVNVAGSIVVPGEATSAYLCVLEHDRRLHVAVADMGVLDRLAPHVLDERRELLSSSDVCVVDANLQKASIERTVELCGSTPVVLDTVSVAKAVRARSCSGRFQAVKPNEGELEVLTGVELRDDRDLQRASDVLHRAGTPEVFVSLGERGLYFSGPNRRGIVAAPAVNARNVSGAGDAMTAAIAFGIADGRSIADTAALAVAAAALTTESSDTVDAELNADRVARLAGTLAVSFL